MNVTVYYPCWDVMVSTGKRIVFRTEDSELPYPEFLSQLFAGFGNHPEEHHPAWEAARVRSMSMGDIVGFDDQIFFQCAAVGWVQITEERVQEVMAMKPYSYWRDTVIWSSMRASIELT